MLSTRLGYGRPARLARAFAFALAAGASLRCRAPFGAGLLHGFFARDLRPGLPDFFLDAMREACAAPGELHSRRGQ